MSNRAIYAIMAIVVIAAVVGIYVMVQGPAEDPQVTAETKPAPTTGFGGPGRGPATSPSLPSVGSGSANPDNLPDKVREYASNGAIVRDHRTGTHAPIDVDPNARPANTHKLPSTLTKAVADRVRDVMHECVATLPASARGSNPRLEGSINIAISGKQVSINTATINVRDVNGEAAEATRTCIEQKTLAITHPAADEDDLTSYDINLSFALI